MYDHLTLISGRAHKALAQEIAEYLGLPLGPCEICNFPDGETFVQLEHNIRGRDVFLIEPTGPPANENHVQSSAAGTDRELRAPEMERTFGALMTNDRANRVDQR